MRPFDLPLGYKYATHYAGIRKQEKDDLALIVSGVPAAAAAVFTTNKVQAAPVRLSRANMRASKGLCGAILVNSGNANYATKSGILGSSEEPFRTLQLSAQRSTQRVRDL